MSAVLVVIIVWIALAQGIPNPLAESVRVQIGLLGLALFVSGNLAGWRWELSGGTIALAGWGLFLVPVLSSPRALTGFVLALALPGALYVTSALIRGGPPVRT